MNVREHNPDIFASLKYPDRFVSVRSFDNLETRISDEFRGAQTDQWFIFNDENRRNFLVFPGTHSLSRTYWPLHWLTTSEGEEGLFPGKWQMSAGINSRIAHPALMVSGMEPPGALTVGPLKPKLTVTRCEGFMRRWYRFAAVALLSLAMLPALESSRGMAQPRAHVYLFRGLADVFSVGMDTLADELNKRGVYATSHSHTDWKSIADRAAADYKSGKEGPIILVGHSLGADAVMEMADYLGDKGIPVALVVPFDGTQSFPASGNVGRVINFTQRDYAYMRPGPGFHGSLSNVDLSADHSIGHITIDESPQLHARVIAEVLAIVGGRPPTAPKPASIAKPEPGNVEGGATKLGAGGGTAIIAQPEERGAPAGAIPATPPPRTSAPQLSPSPPVKSPQIRD